MLQIFVKSVRNLLAVEGRRPAASVVPVETLVLSYDKVSWGQYKTLQMREELARTASEAPAAR